MTCHDDYGYWPASPSTTRRRIVVGVDGSEASLSALRWASEEARHWDATLELVYVYQSAAAYAFTVGGFAPLVPADPDRCRDSAQQVLVDALRHVGPIDRSHTRLLAIDAASPVQTLSRTSEGASMLVVGARHHRGVGNLLGSTAAGCVRHATCPVVAVPSPPHTPGGSDVGTPEHRQLALQAQDR